MKFDFEYKKKNSETEKTWKRVFSLKIELQ